ncbi:MAG: septum site-determining protein MinD, partial [Ruminiclostridium sp.]
IINKVPVKFKDEEILYDLDEVMDTVGIPLIGVVPEDNDIRVCGSKGLPLPKSSAGFKAYDSVSRRILGESVPLSINID